LEIVWLVPSSRAPKTNFKETPDLACRRPLMRLTTPMKTI